MDEKEKEMTKANSADTAAEVPAETPAEAPCEASPETSEEMPAEEAPGKKKNLRLQNALLRAGAALLAAVVLLAVSKFSAVDLIKGAKESDSVQDEELGTFVMRDVFAILGFYDEVSDNSTQGEYALVPMGGKFVTVHFSKRYLESAAAVETATYDYINGNSTSLDKYFVVEGTTETLSEEMSTKMYEWFDLNKDWMVEAGVIADTDDAATYLSDVVLEVDTVNSMSETLVLVLTGLAAAMLLYMIVEFVLMAVGFYLGEPKKKKTKEAAESAEAEPKTSEEAAEPQEEVSEEGAECINNEEKPENNGGSEETAEEKAEEVQEDK